MAVGEGPGHGSRVLERGRSLPSPPEVTVVTPTRGRADLLERAMASVAGQHGGAVEHIVIGDACPDLARPGVARRLADRFPGSVIVAHPGSDDDYRPARTAALRNLGVELATGRYVAHLDDDNELEPQHIAGLVAALAGDERAVAYSWRRLLAPDGSDHRFEGRNPWFADEVAGRRSYDELVTFGVLDPDDSVMRDVPLGPNGEELFLVDTSEMLIPRVTHVALPFRTSFSESERAAGLCEDRAFVRDALAAGLRFIPSRQVTLRYYMGGYSNRVLPQSA